MWAVTHRVEWLKISSIGLLFYFYLLGVSVADFLHTRSVGCPWVIGCILQLGRRSHNPASCLSGAHTLIPIEGEYARKPRAPGCVIKYLRLNISY